MLNHNQFLLSIVYLFFLPVWRVWRSFSFERKIWRVQVANLDSGASAFSCPSRCQKLGKIFFRHLLYWNIATVFALRQPTSCVFIQRSEILYWENKSGKEFRELKQIVIRVGQRTRYRNFAYCRLCCLSIFPAKLLICCQTLSLKRL